MKFCVQCGTPAPTAPAPPAAAPPSASGRKCASCGAEAQPNVKFCIACGASLTASAPPPPPATKPSSPLIWIVVVLLILALGAGDFFAYKKLFGPKPSEEGLLAPPQVPTLPSEAEPPPATVEPEPTAQISAPPASRIPEARLPTRTRPPAAPPSTATERPVTAASEPPAAAPQAATPRAAPPAPLTQTEAPKRVEILKPETPIPQEPPRPAPPAKPAYEGPPAGVLLWSGQLDKNGSVTIEGKRATFGNLTGELPGVPVMIELDQREFALAEAPGPSNNWKRITIRSRNKRHSVVTIKWSILK